MSRCDTKHLREVFIVSPKKTDVEDAEDIEDYEEFEGTDSTSDDAIEIDSDSVAGIDVTDLPGVGPAIGKRLAESGYKSVEAIAVATPGELAAAGSIGETTAAKIIKAAREMLDIGFEILVSAFSDTANNSLVIVLVNNRDIDLPQDVSVINGSLPTTFTIWTTSETMALEQSGSLAVSPYGMCMVTLPARSVTTLVSDLPGATPSASHDRSRVGV